MKKEELDKIFEEARKIMSDMDYQRQNGMMPDPKLLGYLVELLEKLNMDLMELKQIIGLGIPLIRDKSEKERVNDYLNPSD